MTMQGQHGVGQLMLTSSDLPLFADIDSRMTTLLSELTLGVSHWSLLVHTSTVQAAGCVDCGVAGVCGVYIGPPCLLGGGLLRLSLTLFSDHLMVEPSRMPWVLAYSV